MMIMTLSVKGKSRLSGGLAWTSFIMAVAVLLSACGSLAGPFSSGAGLPVQDQAQELSVPNAPAAPFQAVDDSEYTIFPDRARFSPGELVDYTAQSGDTLPLLASRFNTTVEEILEANSFIPESATTMPPGMPMKIPVYYLPLWGTPYQMIPDSLFVNGPAQVDFNTAQFVVQHSGWLNDYKGFAGGRTRSGAEVVDLVALNYSVSPRLLLALLEYQAGALSLPELPSGLEDYPLGNPEWEYKGVYLQLVWAANFLNNGYYQYRNMQLKELEFEDGRIERIDPWQNAATAALQNYFNTLFDYEDYMRAVAPEGFAAVYQDLFGDPWSKVEPHIPGSLTQPAFILPFEPGEIWAMTSGPHSGWGKGDPLAALDFAPPSVRGGCVPSDIWATAVAPGEVVRTGDGVVVLDLDGDGDERTGWNIFHLHIETKDRVPVGVTLEQGERIGHPSCEGGASTGTHIHIARKYNGEWMPADAVLGFNMEGWVAQNGDEPYLGTMTRGSQTVTACTCSNAASFMKSDRPVPEKALTSNN